MFIKSIYKFLCKFLTILLYYAFLHLLIRYSLSPLHSFNGEKMNNYIITHTYNEQCPTLLGLNFIWFLFKARPKSFNIATAQTDDCAVLINPRALNGPFIRNGNKKSLALSQLLSFMPIDGARNLAQFYYYAHPHMRSLRPLLRAAGI